MKTFSRLAFVSGLLGLAGTANAALMNGSTLSIDAGSKFEVIDGMLGQSFLVSITGHQGLVLGTLQSASGSHSGLPDGSELPGIDRPWEFFGNTGMHITTSEANVLSASGNLATVDFNGWGVTWNNFSAIPLGNGAWGVNPDGVALVTCGVDCSPGDSYSLYYTARVPDGDAFALSVVSYRLTLQGTVSAVPVPAAVWLLGSGLAALLGFSRRSFKF